MEYRDYQKKIISKASITVFLFVYRGWSLAVYKKQ